MKKRKKDGQHIVPKTYLKHWKIDPDRNFVYGIDFSNKYRLGVQTFGLNDKVFKEHKYYNDNSFENPYILEDIFGNDIEPIYNDIMKEVYEEQNLTRETREKIMQWLYTSKMRSPHIRNNIERLSNFITKTGKKYTNKELSKEKETEIENYSKIVAKQVHLNSFVNEEQLKNLLD